MRARTARIGDAAAVHRVIAHYAGEGLLLPRTEAEIREHIARFLVLVEKRGKARDVRRSLIYFSPGNNSNCAVARLFRGGGLDVTRSTGGLTSKPSPLQRRATKARYKTFRTLRVLFRLRLGLAAHRVRGR